MNYEKLSKKALGCMYVATGIATLIVLGIIGGLNIFWFMKEGIQVGTWISVGVGVLAVLNWCISPYFRFHRYGYAINEECIDIKEGYVFVERNIVPIQRLHKLEMNRGPIDQIFGIAKVTVTTAGGDVTLRFLELEKAEAIAAHLRTRINQIVEEERNHE